MHKYLFLVNIIIIPFEYTSTQKTHIFYVHCFFAKNVYFFV